MPSTLTRSSQVNADANAALQAFQLPLPLMAACAACDGGVKRTHLVDATMDGALLLELYSRDGVGAMISADFYEARPAALFCQLVPAEISAVALLQSKHSSRSASYCRGRSTQRLCTQQAGPCSSEIKPSVRKRYGCAVVAQGIRDAQAGDADGVAALLAPLEQKGILKPRSRETLLEELPWCARRCVEAACDPASLITVQNLSFTSLHPRCT